MRIYVRSFLYLQFVVLCYAVVRYFSISFRVSVEELFYSTYYCPKVLQHRIVEADHCVMEHTKYIMDVCTDKHLLWVIESCNCTIEFILVHTNQSYFQFKLLVR